ncbi:MAG: hypothetical protein M5U01_32210 [Ardenticatenaceae bacterium]|nr:hypothetical protein [Ardenticatenaceae bacterium]
MLQMLNDPVNAALFFWAFFLLGAIIGRSRPPRRVLAKQPVHAVRASWTAVTEFLLRKEIR